MQNMGNWQEKGINIKRHLEKGDCDMAETECKNILLSHPAQIDPLVMIVDIYISHNMHKEAIKYADVLIKKDKKNYLGYERAGKSLISLGKFERAKKVIEEGLEIIPNHLQLLIIQMGKSYQYQHCHRYRYELLQYHLVEMLSL